MKKTKRVILGTAGHIDHGKTSLVKALTGVDTDRLKEEKERGITIELGFTFLDLPSGIRLGIVDVPGHEKFVKHMVAGAWGIDLVALIVAANEGVMPQTREHLDICNLLRVKKGLIVITKIDLVDRETIELAKEDVLEAVKNTFLEDSPIVPVSSVTGEGITALVSEIDRMAQSIAEKPDDGLFRLPIDRVFVMKGFGTVVTGTMVSGNISVGETVEVLPAGFEAKVRSLQVYGEPVEKAVAGQRTAVNLHGVEASAIERGYVLARPHTLTPTKVVDAFLEYLPGASRPLRHRTTLRFHIGTSLTTASILLLDREELAPGEGAFVQIRLNNPTVALPSDRFVIRGSSAIQTIGGGVILDIQPTKHRRHAPEVIKQLELLMEGTAEQLLSQHIMRSAMAGVSVEELSGRLAISPREIKELIEKMVEKGEVEVIDPDRLKVVEKRQSEQLRGLILRHLEEFHQRFPMKSGLAKEELRTKLPAEVDPRFFQSVLNALISSGHIVLEKDKLRLPGHDVSSATAKGLVRRVEEAILRAGFQPPSSRDLAQEWAEEEEPIQQVLDHLVHEGRLVKIRAGMYFHRDTLDRLKATLVEYLRQHGEITTPQFKEMVGASRKYTIPLIEYFDQIKLTIRVGEKRILRGYTQESEKSRKEVSGRT